MLYGFCYYLPEGVLAKLKAGQKTEVSPLGRQVWVRSLKMRNWLREKAVPLCQDTGLTVVFIDIGQEVHFTGGDLEKPFMQA
jgi:fumarate hydratase subunit alpha